MNGSDIQIAPTITRLLPLLSAPSPGYEPIPSSHSNPLLTHLDVEDMDGSYLSGAHRACVRTGAVEMVQPTRPCRKLSGASPVTQTAHLRTLGSVHNAGCGRPVGRYSLTVNIVVWSCPGLRSSAETKQLIPHCPGVSKVTPSASGSPIGVGELITAAKSSLGSTA